MTVRELKELLEQFDDDMEVMDYTYTEIESVEEDIWTHTNYPYNKPDKKVVIIS